MLVYTRKAVFPASVVVSVLVALFAPVTFVQAAIVLGLGIVAPAMVLALWKPPTITVAEVLHTANNATKGVL